MRNKRDNSRREKGAAVGLVVSFVAMIAIVGMITFSQYQNRNRMQQKLQQAKTELDTSEKKDDISKEISTDSIHAEIKKPKKEEVPDKTDKTVAETTPASSTPETYRFSANDVLLWPIDGNVILSYSMDTPVYFQTLDQYKCNSALIISGEVGMDVIAAATGEVLSVETTAQTGTTITLNIGSGYKLVYGQLKEVCVKKGDHVAEGQTLGYVSEPTKYYSVEGPNVYFQLLKNEEPVNPLEYLDV